MTTAPPSQKIRICVAGATGWAGRAVVAAILKSGEFELVGAVARKSAGKDLGTALGREPIGIKVSATVEKALEAPTDVMIEFTRPESVKKNVLAALAKGVRVVVGASGLTQKDFKDIEAAALKRSSGVVACGNFSITAALLKHFSLIAAAHIPHWEIVEYAHADKADVPSGSVRELSESLAKVAKSVPEVPIDKVIGPKEARGADVAGTRVHAVRLPSYMVSFEALFGLPDERLTIRHDSGSSAEPYVAGTLMAVRRAARVNGLVRGLDALLFGAP